MYINAMTINATSSSSRATRPASTWKRMVRKEAYSPATANTTSVSPAAATPSHT